MPLIFVNEGEEPLEAYRNRKPQAWHKKIKKRAVFVIGLFFGCGIGAALPTLLTYVGVL